MSSFFSDPRLLPLAGLGLLALTSRKGSQARLIPERRTTLQLYLYSLKGPYQVGDFQPLGIGDEFQCQGVIKSPARGVSPKHFCAYGTMTRDGALSGWVPCFVYFPETMWLCGIDLASVPAVWYRRLNEFGDKLRVYDERRYTRLTGKVYDRRSPPSDLYELLDALMVTTGFQYMDSPDPLGLKDGPSISMHGKVVPLSTPETEQELGTLLGLKFHQAGSTARLLPQRRVEPEKFRLAMAVSHSEYPHSLDSVEARDLRWHIHDEGQYESAFVYRDRQGLGDDDYIIIDDDPNLKYSVRAFVSDASIALPQVSYLDRRGKRTVSRYIDDLLIQGWERLDYHQLPADAENAYIRALVEAYGEGLRKFEQKALASQAPKGSTARLIPDPNAWRKTDKVRQGDYRPRIRPGYYRRGSDYVRVDDVGYMRRAKNDRLGVADWWVMTTSTLTTVDKAGPSPTQPATSYEFKVHEFTSMYRRVKEVPEAWRVWFDRHPL